MESKLSKMASQLDAQYELNKLADRKTKRAEADLLDIEQKLRQLECSGLVTTTDNQLIVQQQQQQVRHNLDHHHHHHLPLDNPRFLTRKI